MEVIDISVDEIKKRSEYFSNWYRKNNEKKGLERGTALSVVVFEAPKYIPYILATIYYGWRIYEVWLNHKDKKTKEMVTQWIENSIERILKLAPKGNKKFNREKCKEDMEGVVDTLIEGKIKNPLSISESLSNKLFDVFKKYCPNPGKDEKELIEYIVDTELKKLTNQVSQQR